MIDCKTKKRGKKLEIILFRTEIIILFKGNVTITDQYWQPWLWLGHEHVFHIRVGFD